MKVSRSLFHLSSITLTGLVLRLYNLGTESLWYDEVMSLKSASASLLQTIIERAMMNHPPLYFLILNLWIRLFGSSEFTLRIISVIFGTLSIIIMYKITLRLFEKKTATTASLLLSLSTMHIYYSQEARPYSLLVFLALLSMHLFLSLLEKPCLKLRLFYVIVTTCMLYSHYSGLFLIFIQNMYFLTSEHRKQEFLKHKIWWSCQAALFGLMTPWAWFFVQHILKIQKGIFLSWIPNTSLISLPDTFYEFSGSMALFILYTCLIIITLLKQVSKKSIEIKKPEAMLTTQQPFLFLFIWMLLPPLFLLLISLLFKPLYLPKYLIISSLPFYILAAKGFSQSKTVFKVLIIGLIVILSAANLKDYYTTLNKPPWKDIAKFVDANAEKNELIIFNAGFCKTVFAHYSNRNDLFLEGFPPLLPEGYIKREVEPEDLIHLDRMVKDRKRLWLILSFSGDERNLIKKRLLSDYDKRIYKKYTWNSYNRFQNKSKINIYLFERKETEMLNGIFYNNTGI